MDEPRWSPLEYRLGRLHRDRLGKLPRKAPLRKGGAPSWDKIGAAMLAGRPLPLSYLQQPAKDKPAAIPAATLRKLDAALQKIADHKKAPAETKWNFIPRPEQVVRVTMPDGVCSDPDCEKHRYGKIIDWGPAGVKAATRDGYVDAAWRDVRPVGDAELTRVREREDRDLEAIMDEHGARLARYGFDDLRPGMKVQVEGMYGTSQRGVIVYLSQADHHVFGVLRLFNTGGPVAPVYIAFTPSAVQVIQDESGVLPSA